MSTKFSDIKPGGCFKLLNGEKKLYKKLPATYEYFDGATTEARRDIMSFFNAYEINKANGEIELCYIKEDQTVLRAPDANEVMNAIYTIKAFCKWHKETHNGSCLKCKFDSTSTNSTHYCNLNTVRTATKGTKPYEWKWEEDE